MTKKKVEAAELVVMLDPELELEVLGRLLKQRPLGGTSGRVSLMVREGGSSYSSCETSHCFDLLWLYDTN